MRFSLSSVVLMLSFVSCSTVRSPIPGQTPIPVEQVLLSDVRGVLSDMLDRLLLENVLRKPDDSLPFVMVEHFDSAELPELDSWLLAQDIRLKLLMSDKVAVPEPEVQDRKEALEERRRVIEQCDFILSCSLSKMPFGSPEDEQHVIVLICKLADARTNLVIWESDAKLLK